MSAHCETPMETRVNAHKYTNIHAVVTHTHSAVLLVARLLHLLTVAPL